MASSGRLSERLSESEDQNFLALGFDSEGYVPAEAKKLLHAWAKLNKEDNDLTKGNMSLMLFKWRTELAFVRPLLYAVQDA